MEISYELTRDDYIEFNYQSIVESKQVFQFFIFQKLTVGITFLAIIYLLSRRTNYPFWGWTLFYFGVLGIWTLLERIIISKILKKVIGKEIDKEKGIIGKKVLSVKKDGLYDLSHGDIKKIDWEEIKFVDEREEHVFIFALSYPDFIIPNNSFRDEEEKKEFVTKVRSYMVD